MLPLSEYREAIRLDEPFPTPVDDPRSNLDLLRVALGGLKNRRYPGIDPDLSIFPQKELAFALHHELVLRGPEPIDDEVTDAINLLLYRHSAHMGRTTAENLMRISDMMPESDYGSARNVAMWRGDVRELAADAVVNAAMPNLLGCKDPLHPCIDNYIQGQGGPWIRNDCSIIREILGHDQEVGDAVLTRGYRLPARYVLHTLGPHLNGGEVTDEDREILARLKPHKQHTVSQKAFEDKARDALAQVNALPVLQNLPDGVHMSDYGDAEYMNEMFEKFGAAMGLGILAMLIVLVLLFRDFLQPITILIALPLSIGGAVLGLLAYGAALDVSSVIGILMLMGIVTKNSILLVDFVIKKRRHGTLRHDALIQSGAERAHPIIMTTIAMVADMLPAVFVGGSGAAFRAPMAVAVICGLTASTLLSLIFVPVMYSLTDDWHN